jgi:hypothetical protein
MGLCLGINDPVKTFVIVIMLQELLVVLARHIDVYIVIPGNVALMTNGADKCTAA